MLAGVKIPSVVDLAQRAVNAEATQQTMQKPLISELAI
jgi:hypothetical protein